VRERTGLKGKALFHPIRLALTGEAEGMELDIAVPAIEMGAALQGAGMKRIPGAAERAGTFAAAVNSDSGTTA
jgi:nondiscriminating glutamyl-tRNA synthetase